jgi:hypothetical protein
MVGARGRPAAGGSRLQKVSPSQIMDLILSLNSGWRFCYYRSELKAQFIEVGVGICFDLLIP